MDSLFKIGNKYIGDGLPCFITYEVGPTHSGLDSAKRLVKLASEAGADAVKFQIFDPDRLVADKSQLFKYSVLIDRETGETEEIAEPLYDLFVRRSLEDDEWRELKAYCDDLNLCFFATIGDDEGLKLVERLGCQSIKVASADVNHLPFLRKIARTGVCLQLDTGSATLGEIETAVDVIRNEGNNNIIIHNCPSGYPARLDSINLNMLKTLKQMFNCPVAYSDHTPGAEMDIAAVALGANLVEKTITEDRMTRSVEHVMSLEPNEMKDFVKTIRDLEVAMGNSRRVMTADEKLKRQAIRRSVFADSDIKEGTLLKDAEVVFKRPGYGLGPDRYEECLNASFKRDIKAGDMVKERDFV